MSLYPLSIGPCHILLHVSYEFLQSPKVPRKYVRSPKKDFINPIFLSPTTWFSFNSFISRVEAREFVAILSGSHSQLLRRPKVTFATKRSCSVGTPVGLKQLGCTACFPLPPSPRLNCEAALPSCEETWETTAWKGPLSATAAWLSVINCSLIGTYILQTTCFYQISTTGSQSPW